MGRTSNSVYFELKDKILSKEIRAGEYLPTIRKLGDKFNVANGTIHSALKKLVQENLVTAENRKGFRVINSNDQFFDGLPVAYVEVRDSKEISDELHENQIKLALIDVAEKKGIFILEINCFKNQFNEFIEQIKVCRVGGLVFDYFNFEEKQAQKIISLCQKMNIPIVIMESLVSPIRLDCILQDNYGGGYQAADWAIQNGFKRFVWLGPHQSSSHSDSRLGGVMARLARGGFLLKEDDISMTNYKDIDEIERLKKYLKPKLKLDDEPVFIFALWSGLAYIVSEVFCDLKLKIGDPHSFISWTVDELYKPIFEDTFMKGFVPPVIVWNSHEIAEQTLDRLLFRKRFPTAPIIRSVVSSSVKNNNNYKKDFS